MTVVARSSSASGGAALPLPELRVSSFTGERNGSLISSDLGICLCGGGRSQDGKQATTIDTLSFVMAAASASLSSANDESPVVRVS